MSIIKAFDYWSSSVAVYTQLVRWLISRTIRRVFACGCMLWLWAALPAIACMSEAEQAPKDEAQLSKQFVEERLQVWRERLGLKDWQISVAMIRRSDLKPKTLGGIRWDKRKKIASISVLDYSEYRAPFNKILEDMEFTIVHELVHLELASLPRSEASRSNEEHAVNRITEALLALDRRASQSLSPTR